MNPKQHKGQAPIETKKRKRGSKREAPHDAALKTPPQLPPDVAVNEASGARSDASADAQRLTLTEEQKQFVVKLLARFENSKTVTEEMRYWFGIEVSKQAQARYNPFAQAGKGLREDLKALFFQHRREFIANIQVWGVASQPTRLVYLDQIFHKYKDAGNLKAACDVLRQAAEEVGGKYTNAQKIDVKTNDRETLARLLGVPVSELPEKPGADIPQLSAKTATGRTEVY